MVAAPNSAAASGACIRCLNCLILGVGFDNHSWKFSQESFSSFIYYPSGSSHCTEKTLQSQEERGTTEDKLVGWHHRLNGLESRSW